MNRERFLYLLAVYGSRESAWPEAERAAMRACLDDDSEARRALHRERELDLLLDDYQPVLPDLSEQILAQLPAPTLTERLLGWLFPVDAPSLLRPALVAAMPLLLGVALGIALPGLAVDDSLYGAWESQERYLLTADAAEVAWYE